MTFDVSTADGLLLLTFKPLPGVVWPQYVKNPAFQAKLPKAGAKIIYGSMEMGAECYPAELEACTLKSLDPYEIARDTFAKKTAGHEVIEAGTILIEQAASKKSSVEEVRQWADKTLKAAEAYGPSVDARDGREPG